MAAPTGKYCKQNVIYLNGILSGVGLKLNFHMIIYEIMLCYFSGFIIRSALFGTRSLLNALLRPAPVLGTPPCRNAARKGTREKARKKKVKVEVQKIGFIPHNQRKSAKYV
jgi:hypothetical protein